MKRVAIEPRPDWKTIVENQGLLFHQNEDGNYWNESAFYRFTAAEIETLESATNELHEMCLHAVAHVIEQNRFSELNIAPRAIPHVIKSWERHAPSVYGRFDFAYDGVAAPKLLEYNADTPTVLLEAAVVQWHWLQERFPGCDQFNSIWEGLVEVWPNCRAGRDADEKLFFACDDSIEDFMTISVLRDTAIEAGLETESLLIGDIGWHSELHEFVDLSEKPIRSLFKLYPWEWIVQEEFGVHLLEIFDRVQWIEPIWKMILSNKGILPVLWQLYPGHPYLLESYFDSPGPLERFVKKPLLGREGANVTINDGFSELTEPGPYDSGNWVWQKLCELPRFDDQYAVIGSWIIGDTSRGIGIRESKSPITNNLSSFVPHLFD